MFRNIPPLLVIFFWYFGVLSVLPLPRDSIELPFGSYLNSRGFYFPRAVWGEGAWLILLAFVLGIAMSWFVARRARQRQMATRFGHRDTLPSLPVNHVAARPTNADQGILADRSMKWRSAGFFRAPSRSLRQARETPVAATTGSCRR